MQGCLHPQNEHSGLTIDWDGKTFWTHDNHLKWDDNHLDWDAKTSNVMLLQKVIPG